MAARKPRLSSICCLPPRSKPKSPVYVVLTMRSDFLGDCAQFPALPEAFNRNQYLVPRMTRAQRRQSIEGPLEVAGVPIAQRLVQSILSDAGDNPENLPVMQHALMRTFEEWRRDGSAEALDISHYDLAGRIEGALHQHAEALWSSLSPEQRCSARRASSVASLPPNPGAPSAGPRRSEHILRVAGAQQESDRELAMSRSGNVRYARLLLPDRRPDGGDWPRVRNRHLSRRA